METQPKKALSGQRFKSVDALRGIAAFVVVLCHQVHAFNNEYGYKPAPYFTFWFGYFGVELFFMISGFVIYYTLQQSNSLKEFWIKRFIRLFPTYWLCLVITFLAVSLFPLSPLRNSSIKEALYGLLMFNGLFGVKSVDPSYWSLLIELLFYLMMSVVLYFKLFQHIYTILWSWLVLVLVYNFIYKLPGLGAFLNLRYGPLFIIGICFYKMRMEGDRQWYVWLLIASCFVTCIFVLEDMHGIAWAMVVIMFLFVMAVFVTPNLFENKLLLFLGKISYPLYLIHQNVGFVMLSQLQKRGFTHPVVVLIPISVCVLIAWLITTFYETRVSSFFRNWLLKPRANK